MRKRKQRSFKFRGYDFKSKLEYDIGKDLIERGVDFEYETVSYSYTVAVPHTYCTGCGNNPAYVDKSYTPDFFLGNGVVVEAKGRFTAAERKKHAAMIIAYPDLDLRMLFQSDNYLTNNKNTKNRKRYSDWCNSKGIKWAVGRKVPKEWIK